jgi:hypothetical protein
MTDLATRSALKAIFQTGDTLDQTAFENLIDSLTINSELNATTNPTSCILWIACGDSNSGGQAPNSAATAYEVSSRSDINFWNVTNSVFENLDLGTNNNLDHRDLTSATHSWELEIANAARRGEFDRPVYYVQTGQGSSSTRDWATTPPGLYLCWPKFLTRVAAARKALSLANKNPLIIVQLTLGINDAETGVPVEEFTWRLSELMQRIRVQLPGCKFLLNTLPTTNGAYAAFSSVISAISSSDVAIVNTTTPVTMEMVDSYHWGYWGMKTFVGRALSAAKTLLGLPALRTTWTTSTMTVDGPTIRATAVDQFAYIAETIYFPTGTTVEFDYPGGAAGADGLVLSIGANVTNQTWTSGASTYISVFQDSSSNFWWAQSLGTTVGSVAGPTVVKCRYRRSGDDLLFETTTDDSTWTTRYTRSNVLSGITTVRLKVTSAVGASRMRVYVNPGRV